MTNITLLRAQGKLISLLAAIQEGADIHPVAELAAKLGVFAVAVAEDEPAEGEILAYWAGMLRGLAASDAPTRFSA